MHLGRCLSRISCSIHPRGIFFPPPRLPSPPSATSAAPLPLARSLARSPGLGSKTMFPLFIDEYYCATLPPRIDEINSQLFYSRPRFFPLLGKRTKIICRKEVVRKIRKGSRWIKFFFFSDFLVWGFNFLENNVAFFYSNLLYLVNGVNKNISRYVERLIGIKKEIRMINIYIYKIDKYIMENNRYNVT